MNKTNEKDYSDKNLVEFFIFGLLNTKNYNFSTEIMMTGFECI